MENSATGAPGDAELVVRYLGGEDAAFEALAKRHLGLVYGYALRLSGDPEAASDIAQDTFVKAWKNLRRFDGRANFRTWLLTIAHRTALDWFRRKKHIPFSDFDREEGGNALLDATPGEEPLPDELFAREEDAALAGELLARLPPAGREVLTLYYEGQMTFAEIGTMLGEPLDTVKSRHRRAIQALRSFTEKSSDTLAQRKDAPNKA